MRRSEGRGEPCRPAERPPGVRRSSRVYGAHGRKAVPRGHARKGKKENRRPPRLGPPHTSPRALQSPPRHTARQLRASSRRKSGLAPSPGGAPPSPCALLPHAPQPAGLHGEENQSPPAIRQGTGSVLIIGARQEAHQDSLRDLHSAPNSDVRRTGPLPLPLAPAGPLPLTRTAHFRSAGACVSRARACEPDGECCTRRASGLVSAGAREARAVVSSLAWSSDRGAAEAEAGRGPGGDCRAARPGQGPDLPRSAVLLNRFAPVVC